MLGPGPDSVRRRPARARCMTSSLAVVLLGDRRAGGQGLDVGGGQRVAGDPPVAALELFDQVTGRMFSPSMATIASVSSWTIRCFCSVSKTPSTSLTLTVACCPPRSRPAGCRHPDGSLPGGHVRDRVRPHP